MHIVTYMSRNILKFINIIQNKVKINIYATKELEQS